MFVNVLGLSEILIGLKEQVTMTYLRAMVILGVLKVILIQLLKL